MSAVEAAVLQPTAAQPAEPARTPDAHTHRQRSRSATRVRPYSKFSSEGVYRFGRPELKFSLFRVR